MSITRTLTPTIAPALGKDLATEVQRSAAAIGLALRVRDARHDSTPVSLTKAECAFLRGYVAEGTDPLTAIREAEAILQPIAEWARTVAIDCNAQRIDVPRIKAGQTGEDGRALVVSIKRDAPNKSELLEHRKEANAAAKAVAWLDTLRVLRAAHSVAVASGIAFAAVSETTTKKAGKRLENHAAALLTADPAQLAALLKAMGLPDVAVGSIVALAKQNAKPALVAPVQA